MAKLPTLDEHNEEQERIRRQIAASGNGAGVACPKCGTELVYTHPGTVNASDPPTYWVHCVSCGYSGLKS